MLNLGTDEILKYPFLPEAGKYLQDKGFTLNHFENDTDQRVIIDKAYERIKTAAYGKIYYVDINNATNKDTLLPREVFSFILAIVLLNLCGSISLSRRFSLAEARRAEKYLEKDLAAKIDINSDNIKSQREYKLEQQELAMKIMNDLFSIQIQKDHEYFVMHVTDYLKRATHFYEREWKLINRYFYHGFILLTPHETVRLVRKELDNYIFSKIQSAKVTTSSTLLQNCLKKILLLAKKFHPQKTEIFSDDPPCIQHALKILDNNENLSHSGRFLLATFLFGRGKSLDYVAKLFKNAPDYNEKVTLYQLRHILGDTGSNIKYRCPSCIKLQNQNLCFAVPDCNGIINPLQFKKKQ